MRIAYVCADAGVPVFGTKGASIHVQEMLRAFLARGADVTLLSPRIEGERPADLTPVEVVALPPIPKGTPETRAHAALALNDTTQKALSRLGTFDLVYERHALFAHAAMEHARERRMPGILEVNAPLLDEQARHRTLSLPDDAAASARRAIPAASAVTAVSPSVAAYVRSLGAGHVEVLPNAVSPDRFPRRPMPSGPFTIGFLGSLKPWHDVATAIQAAAILRRGPVPDARLLVVGDGPERARLEAHAAGAGLGSSVEFTGAVDPAEVPWTLARMHVGLAPYVASAGFYFSPLKLYEYMAAGLAVVASRVGHLPEVVEHGRTGLLTPPGDALALGEVLADLAASPDRRARLGAAARAEVLAHHTWDGVAARVLDLARLQPEVAA